MSLDAELGFIDDHRAVMAVLRDVLAAMVDRIAVAGPVELALLGVTMPAVPAAIPEIHFVDAKARVAATLGPDVVDEPDLAPYEERILGAWAHDAFDSEFLFVTGYPLAKRPFYTHGDPDRPGSSRGFDLLFRGMELVTGGQRLHRHEAYLEALAARGLDPAPFAWYLDAFRYGMPPHGGFAIGLERLLTQLIRLPNVSVGSHLSARPEATGSVTRASPGGTSPWLVAPACRTTFTAGPGGAMVIGSRQGRRPPARTRRKRGASP